MIDQIEVDVRGGDVVAVYSDVHFRAEDKRYTQIAADFQNDLKPNHTIFNGDMHDYHALCKLGRLAKEQVDNGALEDEGEASAAWFRHMYAHTKPGGRKIYGGGNHEAGRWKRFLMENPALAGIPWWKPIEATVEGWELYDQGYELYLGPLTVAHGDELIGSCTKYSTASVAGRYPRENLLYGHTHRIEHHTETIWSQGKPHEHGVWTTGHGQNVDEVDYAKRTRWRLGFAVVQFWKNGRDVGFTVVQHEMFRVGKRLVMHSPLTGKTYSA